MKKGFFFILLWIFSSFLCRAQVNITSKLLRTYFEGVENKYFAYVGSNHIISRNILSQLYNWQGLFISDNIQYIHYQLINHPNQQSLYLKLTNLTQHLSSQIISGQFKSPYSTLSDICQRYYLVRPQLLLVESDQLQTLMSNSWEQQCSPLTIFVSKSNSENQKIIQNYLLTQNYIKHKSVNDINVFVHKDILKQVQLRVAQNQLKIEKQQFFLINQAIPSIYQNLFKTSQINQSQITNPTLIHILQMSHTLSLPDLIDQRRFNDDNRPIFIFNFNPQSKIIANKLYYIITEQKNSKLLFKKILVTFKQISSIIYILIQQNQTLSIIEPNKIYKTNDVCMKTVDSLTVILRQYEYFGIGVLPVAIPSYQKDTRFRKSNRIIINYRWKTDKNISSTYFLQIIVGIALLVIVFALINIYKNFLSGQYSNTKSHKLQSDELNEENVSNNIHDSENRLEQK